MDIMQKTSKRQIAVGACTHQGKGEDVLVLSVHKQPIRRNVTFPVSQPIASQGMVSVLHRQGLMIRQFDDDLSKQLEIGSAPLGEPVIFFEPGRPFNLV
jgi:hypothetical protein